MKYDQNSREPSELVIGIIGPIGCNRRLVIETIETLAKHYNYITARVNISDIIAKNVSLPDSVGSEYMRVSNLMDAGNEMRKRTDDNSILAKLAAVEISQLRKPGGCVVYIIDSLKHPDEVAELKNSLIGTRTKV